MPFPVHHSTDALFSSSLDRFQRPIFSSTVIQSISSAYYPGAPSSSLSDSMLLLINSSSSNYWIRLLRHLIDVHSASAVASWRDNTPHCNSILHHAVMRNLPKVLLFCHSYREAPNWDSHLFNINVQRSSDLCTPLHLAIYYRRSQLISLLILELSADTSLKNIYLESCDHSCLAYNGLITDSVDCLAFINLVLNFPPGQSLSTSSSSLELAIILCRDNEDLEVLCQQDWSLRDFPVSLLNQVSNVHQRTLHNLYLGGDSTSSMTHLSDLSMGADHSNTQTYQVEGELSSILSEHCSRKNCRLAGFSAHCVREVLKSEFPKIAIFFRRDIVELTTVARMLRHHSPESWRAIKNRARTRAGQPKRALTDCLYARAVWRDMNQFFRDLGRDQPFIPKVSPSIKGDRIQLTCNQQILTESCDQMTIRSILFRLILATLEAGFSVALNFLIAASFWQLLA